MKKLFILLATMLTALASSALDFEYGNYKFTTISSTAVECKGFTSSANGSVTTIDVPGQVWNASEQKRYKVQRIAASAFANQRQATIAYVCYGVESIGNYAFQNCTGLRTVYMHSSVMSLGTAVFSGCSNLMSLCYAGEKPFSCTSASFQGMSSSTQLEVATKRGVNACKAISVISAQFSVIVSNITAADIAMGGGCYYNVTKEESLTGDYGEAKLIGFRLSSSNTTGTVKPGMSVLVPGTYSTNYYVTAIDDSCALADTQVKVLDLSGV
ncbi:MAG: leucine-rich repeat protein, partial [Muribaculaceae bacterium]|nr:leucine-rich repeat protein [Muribaculaceae bacterium]